MNELLAALGADVPLTGDVLRGATAFLVRHGVRHTIGHSARVAAAARQLAEQNAADPATAATTGWLHDISTVIPNDQRIAYAEAWGIAVLPEERQVPMIIHQKLSVYMAQHLFEITDQSVSDAIGCHTTLRAQATRLDKVVFIADKLKWGGAGDPPYIVELETAAQHSIDAAATWFLAYLWGQRATLLVIHPWLAEAYAELEATSGAHSCGLEARS